MIFLYLLVLENLVLTCTILYRLVPIGEIWYLLVPSCTKFKISCTCWYHLVQACTNWVNLVPSCTNRKILYFHVPSCTKPKNLVLPCTIMYKLVPACTNLVNPVPTGTGTYQFIPVRTNLLVFVQVYRIPDARTYDVVSGSRSTNDIIRSRRTMSY